VGPENLLLNRESFIGSGERQVFAANWAFEPFCPAQFVSPSLPTFSFTLLNSATDTSSFITPWLSFAPFNVRQRDVQLYFDRHNKEDVDSVAHKIIHAAITRRSRIVYCVFFFH